ncbi:hypothetical protein ACWEO4_14825 [Streptomyces sp. NPDC004393]|uniref:hypothetical protein n=1 Tax=unclassified Streptomyces TaxID=2593676 RepID=UPI0033A23BAA
MSITLLTDCSANGSANAGRPSSPSVTATSPPSGTTCAAPMFVPTAGATYAEKVAGQDDGAAMKYTVRLAGCDLAVL